MYAIYYYKFNRISGYKINNQKQIRNIIIMIIIIINPSSKAT